MLKKLLIAAAAIVVGLVIVKKTDMGSLMQVWWKDAGSWCSRQVPPETRIEQLKIEVSKIDRDIKRAVNQLVGVEVAHDELKKQIDALKERQAQRKKEMTALKEGLEAGSTRVSLNTQSYPAETALKMLNSCVAEYNTGREALKAKEELLRNKQEQLDLADQRIKGIQGRKAELEELVGKLEAQLELVRLKKTQNRIEVNDSQVSKCDQLAEDIKRMLNEETKRAEKYARYGLVTSTPNVVKEGQSKAESIKAAQAALAADDKAAGEQ